MKTPPLAASCLLFCAASGLAGCDKSEPAKPAATNEAAAPGAVADLKPLIDIRQEVGIARLTVVSISRAILISTAKEKPSDGTLKMDDSKEEKTLPETTKPVPAAAADVSGKPYASKPEDWASWKSFGFRLPKPQKCQFQWVRSKPTEGKVVAKCDLDGDGKLDLHTETVIAIISGEAKKGAVNDIVAPGAGEAVLPAK